MDQLVERRARGQSREAKQQDGQQASKGWFGNQMGFSFQLQINSTESKPGPPCKPI
jgi:hypothetical protein